MAKVVYRWVLFQAARLAVWLLTRLLYLPMRLLEALCEVLEDAEIDWLLANTNRRLDARKRLNLLNQIEPLKGTFPTALEAHGHDRR